MSSCCRPGDYDKVFDAKHAQSKARAYTRKGLTGDARRIFDFVRNKMSPGYSVLEVGGGVGEIQLELLRAGAAHAINVELATQYETAASQLIRERKVADRVERHVGDFVRDAAEVPSADVVIMNRVICCYPEAGALVAAAADHARRYLIVTFPLDRWYVRWGVAAANKLRFRDSTFRGFVHPTSVVLSSAWGSGLRPVEHHRGLIWQRIVFER